MVSCGMNIKIEGERRQAELGPDVMAATRASLLCVDDLSRHAVVLDGTPEEKLHTASMSRTSARMLQSTP